MKQVNAENSMMGKVIYEEKAFDNDGKLDQKELEDAYINAGIDVAQAQSKWALMMLYSSDPDFVLLDELCVAWHGGLAAICHDDWDKMRRYAEFKDGFIGGVTGLDANKDGLIDADELEKARIPTVHVMELLSFLDKSKDGKVTIAEVTKMVFAYEEAKDKLVEMWNLIDIDE